ncbi:MAG: hypothetical protein U1E83_11560 [Methylotetracoccus sp.]
MSAPNTQPLKYLDKALGTLRDLGLFPDQRTPAPIVPLLERITGLDPTRVAVIARTLDQMSLFNEVVREQVGGMEIGERYDAITQAFNSIRDDARQMVGQIEDGRIDTLERLANVWQKISRGDISSRFDKIKRIYLDVARDTTDQVERERRILEAYRDFRGALKESEVLALELLTKAEGELAAARQRMDEASRAVAGAGAIDAAARARLELTRDERIRELQDEEQRYQIVKDLSDNLTVGYNTSEVIMARLQQTTSAKERVYQQSAVFFSTNESVLTALSASFSGLHGLHESTETLERMKNGINASLETLSEIGGDVQDAALRAGYGPTVRVEAVKKLIDSVVAYQQRAGQIVDEMRRASTRNSEEIREAVEDGKRRLAALAVAGQALADG